MCGVSDARGAVAKPREGLVTTSIVPRYQDDSGAHFSKFNRGHLAYSGRAAGDDNSLSSHKRLGNYFSVSGVLSKTAVLPEMPNIPQGVSDRFGQVTKIDPHIACRRAGEVFSADLLTLLRQVWVNPVRVKGPRV